MLKGYLSFDILLTSKFEEFYNSLDNSGKDVILEKIVSRLSKRSAYFDELIQNIQAHSEKIDRLLKYFANSYLLYTFLDLLSLQVGDISSFNLILSKIYARLLETSQNGLVFKLAMLLRILVGFCEKSSAENFEPNDLNTLKKILQSISNEDKWICSLAYLDALKLKQITDKRLLEEYSTEALYIYETECAKKSTEERLELIQNICDVLAVSIFKKFQDSLEECQEALLKRLIQYAREFLKKRHRIKAGLIILNSLITNISRHLCERFLLTGGILAEVWNWWEDLPEDDTNSIHEKCQLAKKLLVILESSRTLYGRFY
jgi:hypothetical protein